MPVVRTTTLKMSSAPITATRMTGRSLVISASKPSDSVVRNWITPRRVNSSLLTRKLSCPAANRPATLPRALTVTRSACSRQDHRQVEGWFSSFEKSRSGQRKQQLASKICSALKVHTRIEEEIFYPAFLELAQEEAIHHEAVVEHEGAKTLIAEIEGCKADRRILRRESDSAFRDDQASRKGGRTAWRDPHESEEERNGSRRLGKRMAARKRQLINASGSSPSQALTCRARRWPCPRARLTFL